MDINRVVQQAINDPKFAEELHEAVARAKAGGSGSPEWDDLLKQFGTNSGELAKLHSAAGFGGGALVLIIAALHAMVELPGEPTIDPPKPPRPR
jgi:hypothetical protein